MEVAPRKAQDQFALDRRFRLVVAVHGLLEGSIIIGIFDRDNDGLGGQSMAHCILRGALFATLRFGTGTAQRIAAVDLDLPDRGHGCGHGI
jgi:hypothetical protein